MVREWWRQRIQVLGIETDELLAIERQATPLTPFSRKESQELSESGPLPNGSRLSCGRKARGRKVAESQKKRLASEATQFLPTCERPPASSAC